ncbi:inositol monophosphatase family protein [Spirochaetota bacterium]
MLDDFSDFAISISKEAGKILLKGFRSRDTVVSYKSRTNLLTNIDKASEEFLFNKIRDRFKDHSIIAEEGSRRDTDSEYVWYIDPLDATNNFAHGIPIFCTSIGLYSRDLNKVVVGVIYDPFHDELFSAIKSKGSLLNNKKISVSEIDDIGISILATGFPYSKGDDDNNNLNEFNKFLPKIQGIRRLGSAAMDLAYLSCGRIDGFWEPQLHPWDMAGGSLIVEEAGGKVTRYNGDGFDPEYPEILASNGKIHKDMTDILAE